MALTHFQIENARFGRHADGKGLYLLVQPSGRKSWVLRVQVKGRRRDFGLGALEAISLEDVREKATRWRALAKLGHDPSQVGDSVGITGEQPAADSPRKRTQAERTALSDDRMFQATMELLWNGGIHKMTLKEVGERAGYSRGLASSRFGTKERLFAGLVENMNAEWRKEVSRCINGGGGLEALLSMLDAFDNFLREKPLYAKALFVLLYETANSEDGVRGSLAAVHSDRRQVVDYIKEGQAAGEIRTDLSAERFAFQFMAFIFGTIYQWHMTPAAVDVSEAVADYRRTIFDIAAVPSAT